jgi:peptidoglycan/xylan/chitin deacetylase (PgdA/CDA1 family)
MSAPPRFGRSKGQVPRSIAVAIHDIEPATFERCAVIRDWLDDHGVDRATLLVIPARDLHPLGERSPEMITWLREREGRGDAIAQHGFHHMRSRRSSRSRNALADIRAGRVRGRAEAEFVGLDVAETRRAVESGRRVLKLAGIEPRGFVAPSYAYTPALREIVSARFGWWAELLHVRSGPGLGAGLTMPHAGRDHSAQPGATDGAWLRRGELLFPPIAIGTAGAVRRAVEPTLVRAGAALAGPVLRLDLHPSDVEHPRHMLALEWVLNHARARSAINYDDLAGVAYAPQSPHPGSPQPLAA